MDRELLLLGILRREAMHGYRLVEIVETELRACTDLKKPTAYFLLGKLARLGLVTRTRTREGKRPPKWVYRLTPKGEETFQSLLRENLAAFAPPKYPGSVGLAFLHALAPEEAHRLLSQRLTALEARAAGIGPQDAVEGPSALVASHERHQLLAEAKWLTEILAAGPGRPAAPGPASA